MQPEFWHEIWRTGNTPFHRTSVNPQLIERIPQFKLSSGANILVPLCGKTLDMLWLNEQGYHVFGIELIEQAILEFLEENELDFQQQTYDNHQEFYTENISIFQEDIFNMMPEQLPTVELIYDRAALVSLPVEMRARYVKQLLHLQPSKPDIFLQTIDYPEPEMKPPPFPVREQEVNQLFGEYYVIKKIQSEDRLMTYPELREKGITRFQQDSYYMRRK